MTYQVYNLAIDENSESRAIDGVLKKAWLQHPELGRCLFKEGSLFGLQLDWTEKVAYEIGKVIGLPIARAELAMGQLTQDAAPIRGSISVDCLPADSSAVLGRDFLRDRSRLGDNYTVENIINTLNEWNVLAPNNWQKIPGIDTAAQVFVGQLLLDSCIDNIDRHEGNWSVIETNGNLTLMSCYDQGLSLGAALDDGEATIENYIKVDSLSPFEDENGQRITTLAAFDRAATLEPNAAKIWPERLLGLTGLRIRSIVQEIPPDWISPERAKLAIELIKFKREAIVDPERRLTAAQRLVRDDKIDAQNRSPERP